MSKLRAKPATEVRARLKALFYGASGTGKTTCAISFPKPYYFDSERGGDFEQYNQILQANGGVRYFTRDFADLSKEIQTLATEKHDYKTIVIDSITPIYRKLIADCGIQFGTAHNRHYIEVHKQFERLLDLLLEIDMNVIITAHTTKKYDGGAANGNTYEADSKIGYIFDLTIETKEIDRKHKGFIESSRIKTIPIYTEIDFNYSLIRELYGRDKLESECRPLLSIVEPVVNVSYETIISGLATEEEKRKILKSYSVSNMNELEPQVAIKIVDVLTKRRAVA